MALLAAPLAATVLATLGQLESRAIAGGRFGGIARAAADPLPQAGQFGSQSVELGTQLLDLLLLEPGATHEQELVSPASQLLKSQPVGRPSQPISA